MDKKKLVLIIGGVAIAGIGIATTIWYLKKSGKIGGPTAEQMRAYLNQLIQIRGQQPAALTNYFKLDFTSNDPAVMAQCIVKLVGDINYQYTNHKENVTQPAPPAPWEYYGAPFVPYIPYAR